MYDKGIKTIACKAILKFVTANSKFKNKNLLHVYFAVHLYTSICVLGPQVLFQRNNENYYV